MKKHSWAGHALPLDKSRFLCCATVATGIAEEKLFRVERNVARSVASNVDSEEHSDVAIKIAIHIAGTVHDCALNVASVLRRLCANLLPRLLIPL
jgi:hypothetical protein